MNADVKINTSMKYILWYQLIFNDNNNNTAYNSNSNKWEIYWILINIIDWNRFSILSVYYYSLIFVHNH